MTVPNSASILLVMKSFLLMAFLFLSVVSSSYANERMSSLSKVENKAFTEEFMELVNNHRNILGLRGLALSEDLTSIAQVHSLNMARRLVEFGHIGFELRCLDARLALGGGNLCAENVAMGQRNPLEVFTAWINSEGHRLNIESSRATHTGFAFVKSDDGIYYWTQIFLEKVGK